MSRLSSRTRLRPLWLLVLAMGGFFSCLPALAHADTFTLATADPANLPNQSVAFSIDPSQPPVDAQSGLYFGTYAQSEDLGEFYATFGSSDYGLDLGLFGQFGVLAFTGDQLYSGDESNPVFLAGTFNLASLDGTAYTLTISTDASAAVAPEPPTILLLLSGGCFGIFLLRSRLSGRLASSQRTGLTR